RVPARAPGARLGGGLPRDALAASSLHAGATGSRRVHKLRRASAAACPVLLSLGRRRVVGLSGPRARERLAAVHETGTIRGRSRVCRDGAAVRRRGRGRGPAACPASAAPRVGNSDGCRRGNRQRARLVRAHADAPRSSSYTYAHRYEQRRGAVLHVQPELPPRTPPLPGNPLVQPAPRACPPAGRLRPRRGECVPLVRSLPLGRAPRGRARARPTAAGRSTMRGVVRPGPSPFVLLAFGPILVAAFAWSASLGQLVRAGAVLAASPLLPPLRGRPPLLRLHAPPVGLRLWDRTGAGSRSPIASRGRVDSMRRLARWIRYVNAMFPPVILAPVGAAQFLSLYLVLQTLGGVTPLRLGWRAAIGAASTVLWMLLIRLQDDIVDAPADIRLGRAGDPRYRDRPVVQGDITVRELRQMAGAAAVTLIGLNVLHGPSAMLLALVVGLAITRLGFAWFFIPSLARDPSPLAYLVRKVLTVLFGLYACAVYRDEFGELVPTLWVLLLLLAP